MKAFNSSSSSLDGDIRFDFRLDKLAADEPVRVDKAMASRKGWRSVEGTSQAPFVGTPDVDSDKLKQEKVRPGDREDEKSGLAA